MGKIYGINYAVKEKFYVSGPGIEHNCHGEELWPTLQFNDKQNADRAATLANIAYKEGYRQAQIDIQKALTQFIRLDELLEQRNREQETMNSGFPLTRQL